MREYSPKCHVAGPLVSVVAPVYNVREYIDTCVESIVSQTYPNLEIILVDDGSTDGCASMCDAFAANDSRIRVVHKANAGLGMARNSGLAVATGRYIMFVDSDDYMALNTVAYCVDLAERTGADQVRFVNSDFHSDKNIVMQEVTTSDTFVEMRDFPSKAAPILGCISNIDGYCGVFSTASACMAMYRREAIVASGLLFHSERELISEDFIFNIEFAALSGTIVYTQFPFYFYRINLQSLSKQFKADRMVRSVLFAHWLKSRLEELGYPDAELISIGNLLGYLRLHLRHIYQSDFTQGQKRRLHYEAVRHPEVMAVANREAFGRLPRMQRLAYSCYGSYFLSRLLSDARKWMKSWLRT